MASTDRTGVHPHVLRWLTHPVSPALATVAAAGAVAAGVSLGRVPPVLAWVVVALAAGYAVSGSV